MAAFTVTLWTHVSVPLGGERENVVWSAVAVNESVVESSALARGSEILFNRNSTIWSFGFRKIHIASWQVLCVADTRLLAATYYSFVFYPFILFYAVPKTSFLKTSSQYCCTWCREGRKNGCGDILKVPYSK